MKTASTSLRHGLVLLLATGWTLSSWAAPTRLEIGGEPAPENIQVLHRDGADYLPALAVVLLGCGLQWDAPDRTAVAIVQDGLKAQFSAGAAEVTITAGGAPPARQALAQAPVVQDGTLWLPLAAIQDVLKLSVERDGARKTLRVGAPPAPGAEDLQAWCRELGVPDAAVFHRSGFRVKLEIPQGNRITSGQEFALNVQTNADGCVQVYLKDPGSPPLALWGVDTAGAVIRDPLVEGYPERGRPTRAGQIERWRLRTTLPAGEKAPEMTWVFAIASDAPKPPGALLDALKRSAALRGSWAIDALQVTVVPPGQ